jgi:hypothetical protein
MAAIEIVLSSNSPCTGPPILMGDDTPVEVIEQGRVELQHEGFGNVLHVPKLFVNLLFVYQITHYDIGKRVDFTPDSVTISDMRYNSRVIVSEVNH